MISLDRMARKINLNGFEVKNLEPFFKYGTYSYNKIKNGLEIHAAFGAFKEGIDVEGKVLDLRSEGKTVYGLVFDNFYHFLSDTAGKIISFINIDPTLNVVLDICPLADPIEDFEFMQYFIKCLKDNNINCLIVNSKEYDSIIINDYSISQFYQEVSHVPAVHGFFKNYVKDKNIKPFRNVYVSRKKTSVIKFNPEKYDTSRLSINTSERIDDHNAIENMFKSLGYEIVYGEDFKTLEEKINYFNEVKTIVSISGAGLTHAMFMQPNQTMIEIFTPQIVIRENKLAVEEIHFFYHSLAAAQNHKYISINNFNRKFKDLEKNIIGDTSVYNFIMECAK